MRTQNVPTDRLGQQPVGLSAGMTVVGNAIDCWSLFQVRNNCLNVVDSDSRRVQLPTEGNRQMLIGMIPEQAVEFTAGELSCHFVSGLTDKCHRQIEIRLPNKARYKQSLEDPRFPDNWPSLRSPPRIVEIPFAPDSPVGKHIPGSMGFERSPSARAANLVGNHREDHDPGRFRDDLAHPT